MLNKLHTHVAALGIGNALLFWCSIGLKRLGGFAYINREIVYVQPVAAKPLLPGNLGRTIEVRQLLPGEPALAGMPGRPGVFDYRFGQGSVCLGAFHAGDLVGLIWLCSGPYQEDVVRCRFVPVEPDDWAWDYGLFIKPEVRNSLVFARLWDAANAYLRANGINWTYSRISAFNPRSIGPHEKLGARRLGTMLFIGVGRLQLMRSTLEPRFHVSLGPRHIPDVLLSPGHLAHPRLATRSGLNASPPAPPPIQAQSCLPRNRSSQ